MEFYKTFFVCPLCKEEHYYYVDAESCILEHLKHGMILGYAINLSDKHQELAEKIVLRMYNVNIYGVRDDVVFEELVKNLID